MSPQDFLRAARSALDALPSVGGVPGWAVAAVTLAFALVALRAARSVKAARASGDLNQRFDAFTNLAVAGLATAVSANGMWRFFGDQLHIHGPERIALFAYLEIMLAQSAVRARRVVQERIERILATKKDDPEGINVHQVMVWTVAGLSGVLAALDAPGFGPKIMRLAAPLLAAAAWEIGHWADLVSARRKAGLGRVRSRVAWRVSPERLLVWLRLAEPTARDAGEVDQTRRITSLARAAYRAHTAPAGSRRRRWWEWRLRRLAFAAINHADLGADPEVARGVQMRLAAAFQLVEGTSRAAVAHLQPWGSSIQIEDDDQGQDQAQDLEHEQMQALVSGPGERPAIEAANSCAPFVAETEATSGATPVVDYTATQPVAAQLAQQVDPAPATDPALAATAQAPSVIDLRDQPATEPRVAETVPAQTVPAPAEPGGAEPGTSRRSRRTIDPTVAREIYQANPDITGQELVEELVKRGCPEVTPRTGQRILEELKREAEQQLPPVISIASARHR